MSDRSQKLRVERISKAFAGSRGNVLREVSFNLHDREFVSIIGRSGCGKTTLLRIVAGLERPSDGRVRIMRNGQEETVSRPGPDRGMVFQEHFLFPWRTALKNIEFGLEFGSSGRAHREQVAHDLLKLVNLEHAADLFPSQMSGGMRQRIAIARALAPNPNILLLDEPFASLDSQTRNAFHDELLRIQDVTGKTILLVTHNIDEAIYLSDRIVVLKANPGEILEIVRPSLPRPRDRSSPAFVAEIENLARLLKHNER